MNATPPRCRHVDTISDRPCAFDQHHMGRCNFAPLGHNTIVERVLRRRLDAMTEARDGLVDLALRLLDRQSPLEPAARASLVALIHDLRDLEADVFTHASELDA